MNRLNCGHEQPYSWGDICETCARQRLTRTPVVPLEKLEGETDWTLFTERKPPSFDWSDGYALLIGQKDRENGLIAHIKANPVQLGIVAWGGFTHWRVIRLP
jgi:hypothetical protein